MARAAGIAAAADAAALPLEENLAAVAVVVDGLQLVLLPMGEAAKPPYVVAQFAATVAAAELLPVVTAIDAVVVVVAAAAVAVAAAEAA